MPESLLVRSQIIHASLPLFSIRPLSGLGLGAFSYYYSQIRTESVTAGVYLHNDTLQLMIEMGIPCIIVFLTLWISAFIVTTKSNIISLAVLLAVFLHSMMEFQFYLPAISMLTGVALAYHRLNSRALTS
jgi:O-antigen ligase